MTNHWLQFAGIPTIALVLAGCGDYRPDPLQPTAELGKLVKRDVENVAHEVRAAQEALALPVYNPQDGLDEAEMVMVALSFNPDLRNRRYASDQVGTASLGTLVHFSPELKVNVSSVTVGFATDSEVLYTLLVPSARAAWRAADQARIVQARAEMLAAECIVVADVRRTRLAVLVADRKLAQIEEQLQRRQQLAGRIVQVAPAKAGVLEDALITLDLSEARRERRQAANELAAARRRLNELLGFGPDYPLVITDIGKPLAVRLRPELTDEEIDRTLLAGRWELKALEANYQREEYNVRRKAFAQFPQVRLGPALTYDRVEGTSFALGLRMSVPWPERSAENLADAESVRDRARASYVAKLLEIRSEAHGANERIREARTEITASDDDLRVAAQHAAETMDELWTQGETSLKDYLDVLRRIFADERQRLDAQADYMLARIDLEYATGMLNTTGMPPATKP